MLAVALLVPCACGKKTPQQRLEKARSLNEQQKYFDALIELKAILRDYPADPATPDVIFELARTHAVLGQIEQAEERFKEVLERTGPRDSRGQAAIAGLFNLYERAGNFDAAIQLTRQTIEALPKDDPTTAALQIRAAQYYMMKRQFDDAIAILTPFRRSWGDLGERLFIAEMLAVCYAQTGRFDDAIREYDDALALTDDPGMDARIQIGRAYYLSQAGRTAEADEATSRAIGRLRQELNEALDPQLQIRLHAEIARAFELLKKDDLAEAEYRTILSKFQGQPDVQEIYDLLTTFFVSRRQWDKARALLEEQKNQFPSPLLTERINGMLERLEALRLQDQSTSPTRSANAAP
ncbi:MAG: hypothetical protein Kow0059_18620 [Candidatus Sumerlaeia bacterium]